MLSLCTTPAGEGRWRQGPTIRGDGAESEVTNAQRRLGRDIRGQWWEGREVEVERDAGKGVNEAAVRREITCSSAEALDA